MAETYALRQRADGDFSLETRQQVLRDPTFQATYARLRVISHEARHTGIEEPDLRLARFAPDSEYADLLVALGRRLPNEPFAVGDSPQDISYIESVVIPTLKEQADAYL